MAIIIVPKEQADLEYKVNRLTYGYGVEKSFHDEAREIMSSLDDDAAANLATLYDEWQADMDVTVGQRLQYGGKLFKVIQAHHTQEDWTPDKVPALFVEVAKPGEIPVWKQPTGAHDAYNKGDKVHYPTATDPIYECDTDANVYAPGVYGWHLAN